MKISLDWLNEYITLPKDSAEEIGGKLTLHTCEVEEVLPLAQHLDHVFAVEIEGVQPHPQSDHLNLVTFSDGERSREVVCGAPNVRVGLRVPFAPVGTVLPGGFTLSAKKIRGVLSEGMLCGEKELELGEDGSGLLELEAEAPLGVSLSQILKIPSDSIFEIDNKSLTHRPDLWGHYGIARELSCIYGKELNAPDIASGRELVEGASSDSPINVHLSDGGGACQYFLGISVRNASVKPSASWMQQRLTAVGMRPINNIVDISNYVMLEMGQPNHIYDATFLEGDIRVSSLKEGSEFITLDEHPREMKSGDTMIFDDKKAIGIAGIMGGLGTSVQENSCELFIEVANWVDHQIRQTSTRLGLRTDASQRYEKSLDSHLCLVALQRILTLLKESCPSLEVVGSLVGTLDKPLLKGPRLPLDPKRIQHQLGVEIPAEKMFSILEGLGFQVDKKGGTVQVPTFRATKDIQQEADILEEIGRIHGYDNITAVSPLSDFHPTRLSPLQRLEREVKEFMVFHGNSLEIMTYPMIGSDLLERSEWETTSDDLILLNSISPEHDRMRPSLIPSFLEAVKENSKERENFNLFECGRVYSTTSSTSRGEGNNLAPEESHQLIAACYTSGDSEVFMPLLNVVEKLHKSLRLPYRLLEETPPETFLPSGWKGLHPYEYLNFFVAGNITGTIFSVHPLLLKSWKLKGHLSFFILDLTQIAQRNVKSSFKFKPIVRQPFSRFDSTLFVERHLKAESLVTLLKKSKIPSLHSVFVQDIYYDSETHKSVTIRTRFQNRERTLTGEEISECEKRVIELFKEKGYTVKEEVNQT